MRCLLLLLSFITVFSCSKGPGNSTKPNNNQFKATVVLKSGSSVSINATTTKAVMGCASFGGGSYVDGMDNTNGAAVDFSIYANGIQCVTNTGMYTCFCQYIPGSSPNSGVGLYSNAGLPAKANITITNITSNYMEGSFTAVCWNNSGDTALITGSFSGNHLGP